AQIEDLVERWEDIYGPDGALMAWFESFNNPDPDRPAPRPRPRQMPDFTAISQVVDRAGKMVERIHKMKNEGSISMATLQRVTEQMGADLVAAINEQGFSQDQSDKLIRGIEARWNSIRLEPGRVSDQRDS
ncbi:MAG TPA: hypothetical protein VJ302_27690, partial [Blastocatellia bacterium]|nr:hypothetical protein [Blastocatellia bacterium]